MFDLLSMFLDGFIQEQQIHKKIKKEKRRNAKRAHIRKVKRRIKKRLIENKHHYMVKHCDSSSSSDEEDDECLDKHRTCLYPRRVDNSHNKNKIVEKLYDVIQDVDNKITCNTLQSNMSDYFIKDQCTGILTPKFIQMNVNDTIINVPTYTLVNHTNMNVKDFKCKFKTDAYNLGVHSNKNFDIETEVTFTRDSVSDGYVRINEILLKDNF
jgi:hypothetical protein